MNRDEAKTILLLYRPGTVDEGDPQVAEALALAKQDAELARWLAEHTARQAALRAKFQAIKVPEGLKEQIISEQAASERRKRTRRNAVLALAAVTVVLVLAVLWFPSRPADDTFAVYRQNMVSSALRGYAMDLATNNPAEIRSYLSRNQAPADFVLPAALTKAEIIGCSVQNWQGAKVSMICFRTGKPLPPGQQGDLWLFVVDRAAVKQAPDTNSPGLASVNTLITATWTQDGKLYLLGTPGDERTILQFL